MRPFSGTIALLTIALMAYGCGGTLKTTGTGDGTEEDTETDFEGDTSVDGEDVPPDAEPDVGPDVAPEVTPDTEPDPTTDPTTEPEPDSTTDPTTEPEPDATTDPTTDAVTDATTDTVTDPTTDIHDILETVDYTEIGDVTLDVIVDTTMCSPGTERCFGGNYQICRTDGSGWNTTVCTYDCLTTPYPHCGDWDPSNIGMAVMDDGTQPLGPTNPEWQTGTVYLQFESDTGEIWGMTGGGTGYTLRPAGTGLDTTSGISFDVITQSSGAPDIGVFSVTSVDIPAAVEVWTVGSNAFALAASDAISIAGTFNCKAFYSGSSRVKYPGPGGYGSSLGPGAGGDGTGSGSTYEDGGGGGASFGGTGGDSGPGSYGGAGGSTYGGNRLVPLWGGSGGGDGADNPGYGGPGGGACEFVSMVSITVASTGGIDAAGHGGDGGGARGGGGGGGSGGGLLLEAPTITISGMVATNGGGGGSGARSTGSAGVDGERGILGLTAAPGGTLTGTEYGCDGGDGNTATVIDGNDNYCESTDNDGGGGGAGSGRIRINAMTRSIASDTLSPALATSVCTQANLPLT